VAVDDVFFAPFSDLLMSFFKRKEEDIEKKALKKVLSGLLQLISALARNSKALSWMTRPFEWGIHASLCGIFLLHFPPIS